MTKYLLLIFEFFYIKRGKLIISFLLSLMVGFSIYYGNLGLSNDDISAHISNSINVLGILLGFTASIFAIIITNDNKEINNAKEENTKRKLYKTPFTIYDELVISCGFLVILMGFLLIMNFLLPVYKNIVGENYLKLFSANLSLIIFAVVLLVSSILEFYFIITKRN
jgi:hypothetical protein